MTDRNIVDLAHAVLDTVVPDVPWKIQLQEFQARAAAAPTLARAALRVSALADLLDAEADRVGSRGGAFTARAFATEIRTALNGENRG